MKARAVPAAVVDALSRPAIPNGTALRPDRAGGSRRLPPEALSRAVVTVQPGIGGWECDACGQRGSGGFALLAHWAQYRHTRYTPREDVR